MTHQTSPTEPFRFTDADGDYLHIGIPNSPTTGHPALSFHTMAEPVHVPVEEVEGLITALRRLVAAQAAAPAVVEPPADQTGEVRDQLLHAIDFNYVASLGYTSPEELLATYDTSRTPAVQAALRTRIAAAALAAVEAALGDTLVPAAREEALAGIVAVLPAPADRAGVLREAADHLDTSERLRDLTDDHMLDINAAANELRRMADETATTETHSCGNCEGVDPDTCFNNPNRPPEQCPRSEFEDYGQQCQKPASHNLCSFEEQPAAETQQDDVWPVKDATRRYAAELRATSGTVVSDGHTGWECDAGAQLLVAAETPRPGQVATHHGVIYACAVHRAAAAVRIMGAGYEADSRPAPPGHRWNPWPCGHVTAYSRAALTALTVTDESAAGARQDGAQP